MPREMKCFSHQFLYFFFLLKLVYGLINKDINKNPVPLFLELQLARLQELGFSMDDCRKALLVCQGDLMCLHHSAFSFSLLSSPSTDVIVEERWLLALIHKRCNKMSGRHAIKRALLYA